MGVSSSALATKTGHVILMSSDVRKIPKAIMLTRRAHRKVVENVIPSIATKVAILGLAFRRPHACLGCSSHRHWDMPGGDPKEHALAIIREKVS